jgi:ribosomal protein L30/L7E
MIVVIRITGQVNLSAKTKNMLHALNLDRKYSCILLEKENVLLEKVKDLVAYGEFDDKLMDRLKKRSKGEYFALHPPVKGLKKSSKLMWPRGILGNQGKEINKLLERMI